MAANPWPLRIRRKQRMPHLKGRGRRRRPLSPSFLLEIEKYVAARRQQELSYSDDVVATLEPLLASSECDMKKTPGLEASRSASELPDDDVTTSTPHIAISSSDQVQTCDIEKSLS